MKLMSYFILVSVGMMAINANARVLNLNCESQLIKEQFFTCPDGEAGSNSVCGSNTNHLGTLHLRMDLDSNTSEYTGHISVTNAETAQIKSSPLKCIRGNLEWTKFYMSCQSLRPVLGDEKLSLNFNVHRFEIGEELVHFNINMPLGPNKDIGIGSVSSHINCENN